MRASTPLEFTTNNLFRFTLSENQIINIPSISQYLPEFYDFDISNKLNSTKNKEIPSNVKLIAKQFLEHKTIKSNKINSVLNHPDKQPSNNQLETDDNSQRTVKKRSKKKKTDLSAKLSFNIKLSKWIHETFMFNPISRIVKCYFYAILLNMPKHLPIGVFGYLLPIKIKIDFKLKIIDHFTHNVEHCKLLFIEEREVPWELFEQLVIFHIKLINDCFNQEETTKENIQEGQSRCFSNSKEKMFLIVPIRKGNLTNTYDINYDKIKHCIGIMNEPSKYCLSKIIEEYYQVNKWNNCDSPTEEQKQDLLYSINHQFTYTNITKSYSFYNIIDWFFPQESFNTFLDKFSCHNKEYSQIILNKYFPRVLNVEENQTNTYEIMTEFVTSSSSILYYRKWNAKHPNIMISTNPKAYVYAKNIYFNCGSMLFNRIIKNSLFKNSIAFYGENIKEKQQKIHSIWPFELLCTSYLDQNDIECVLKLPSIFLQFESWLTPYDFIQKESIWNHIEPSYDKYKYILWSLTSFSCIQEYSYENLETWGDSILKFLISVLLYTTIPNYEVNELVTIRSDIVNNKALFEIGSKLNLHNYIISNQFREKDVKDYKFPLNDTCEREYQITITEKSIADVVESIIGGVFLYTNNLVDCYEWIKKYGLVDSITQYVEGNLKINHSLIIQMITLKENSFDDWAGISNPNIIDVIKPDLSFIEWIDVYNNSQIDINCTVSSIEELEEKCWFGYKFKNISLLEAAMTHKSYNQESYKNYEQWEYIGDSIVEVFITTWLFKLFAPYMHQDYNENTDVVNISKELLKNAMTFNNEKMANIKSILCSNKFMCSFSSYLHLHEVVRHQGKNKQLKRFLSDKKNIITWLNRKLNDYNHEKAVTSKIIADLFEAWIGAIYIDGGWEKCFEFLNRIYKPFIEYTAWYFDIWKINIIEDFTSLSERFFKIIPKYKEIQEGNDYVVEVYINEDLLCKGIGDNYTDAKTNAVKEGIHIWKTKYNACG